MWRIIILAALVAACGTSDARSPNTRYLASNEGLELENRIRVHCLPALVDSRGHSDDSLPDEYNEITQFRCLLRLPDGRKSGWLPFTLQGSSTTLERLVCALRIGPAPIRAPVPLDMVLEWIDDRALAESIRQIAGTISYDGTYQISFTTRGVHVWMQQFFSALDGPQMELSLDGCGRLPDAKVVRTIYDDLKVFGPQAPPAIGGTFE